MMFFYSPFLFLFQSQFRGKGNLTSFAIRGFPPSIVFIIQRSLSANFTHPPMIPLEYLTGYCLFYLFILLYTYIRLLSMEDKAKKYTILYR